MVWSLGLRPDNAKQDPVVYGAEFDIVFLAKGPRTASIQEGVDCLGLSHSGLEGERYFRLIVELTCGILIPPLHYMVCSMGLRIVVSFTLDILIHRCRRVPYGNPSHFHQLFFALKTDCPRKAGNSVGIRKFRRICTCNAHQLGL